MNRLSFVYSSEQASFSVVFLLQIMQNKLFLPSPPSLPTANNTRTKTETILSSRDGGVLQLQSESHPLPVYHALSTLLARTDQVTILDLSDCCLTSDTINILLQAGRDIRQ